MRKYGANAAFIYGVTQFLPSVGVTEKSRSAGKNFKVLVARCLRAKQEVNEVDTPAVNGFVLDR